MRLVYQTSADQLYQDYHGDPVGTQLRIGTSWIRVRGTVAELGKQADDTVVRLSVSPTHSVSMRLRGDQAMIARLLVAHETVELQCDRMQRTGNSVLGSGCFLVLIDAASTAPTRQPATGLPPAWLTAGTRASWATYSTYRHRRDFLTFAARCGPRVDPTTTAAIVKTESDYDDLVIRDNTLSVTFRPSDRLNARLLVDSAIRAGHQLAIGLMQVTTSWVRRLNIKAADLLDPCTNIRVGTNILAANYQVCSAGGRAQSQTMACALSMYWSGDPTVGGVYVNDVYRHANSRERVPVTPGVSDGVLGTSTGAAHRP